MLKHPVEFAARYASCAVHGDKAQTALTRPGLLRDQKAHDTLAVMKTNDWSWTEPLWESHFAGIGGPQATVQRLEQEPFWQLFETQMRQHFPPEAFFGMKDLVPHELRPQRARLAEDLALRGPEFYAEVRMDGQLAAMFAGCPFSTTAWRMWVTVVNPQFRRQGLYRQILEGHLGYSKALGFDVVRSEHALCNNAILIAKLKSGFRVTSMEINPEHGPSVILTYFHHKEQENAYLYRCGMATMNKAMLQSGNAAMHSLAEKFCEAADT